jgi:uncharacterized protein
MTTTQLDQPPLIITGLAHWRNKEWFDAHQCWEDYWHTIRKHPQKQEEAQFLKGMIQLAVALVHRERGNNQWYERLTTSARELLENHKEHYINGLREELLRL